MTSLAAPFRRAAARPAVREAPAGRLLLPVRVARGLTFAALATFGALHWMAMLEPSAGARGWKAVGIALLAVLGLLVAAALPRPERALTVAGVVVGSVGLALLAGGVDPALLAPAGWAELVSGIARGIEALPGARVPYRGMDPWTRTVIPLGGTGLVVLAALLAFWPRRHGHTGRPLVALVVLVTLYAVPAVSLDFDGEFLRGALLTLLVLAFLRLERLRVGEAPAAGALALAALVLALLVAPALDEDYPWWDYETWALSTASAKSTSFSWNHDYGPLDWPRDGREVLRVKPSRRAAYWKAENLDAFDGRHWTQDTDVEGSANWIELRSIDPRQLQRWTQRIEVSVRNLRSQTFITAGSLVPFGGQAPLTMESNPPEPSGVPGILEPSRRALRRGDAYRATVYTPSPSEDALRAAAGDGEYPFWLVDYERINLPGGPDPNSGEELPGPAITFPSYAQQRAGFSPTVPSPRGGLRERDATRTLERSHLRRTWELSRRLLAESTSPIDYALRVEEFLRVGFTYSESPPPSAGTLEGFLFDARQGFCQQYSGAMALLLRMAGIPARVSTGFTAGSYDDEAKEYVVRDLDAHSWVEMWVRGYGWVTRDPTPAAAPPRSRIDETTGASGSRDNRAPTFSGSERASDPNAGPVAQQDGGPAWWMLAGTAAAALALVALLAVLVGRRGRTTPLGELERALRRTRRDPGPGTTLRALERAFAPTPAAAGYVRALREQRYGAGSAGPTREQRRGLRAELARGSGLAGRARAWWALPPRLRRG